MLLQGVRLTVFLIVPLASALMALAYPLVSLYHAGEFTEGDVVLVAQVLFWWGTTLPLYAVYMYLYRVFSALKDLVALTKVDVALRVVNIACYVVLTSGWGPFEGLGMIGIPLADTVFYVLMNAALLFMLQRRVGSVVNASLVLFVAKASVAAVAGGCVGYALMQDGLLWRIGRGAHAAGHRRMRRGHCWRVWLGVLGFAHPRGFRPDAPRPPRAAQGGGGRVR